MAGVDAGQVAKPASPLLDFVNLLIGRSEVGVSFDAFPNESPNFAAVLADQVDLLGRFMGGRFEHLSGVQASVQVE